MIDSRKLLVAWLAATAVAGCTPRTTNMAGTAPSARSYDLSGKWVGEIAPLKKSKDGSDSMAKALMSMFKPKLELGAGNSFKMTVGISVEGRYKIDGSSVTFTPERAMGKTKDELKKMAATMGSKADPEQQFKPMTGRISLDGATITVTQSGDDSQVSFRRAPADDSLASTVNASEKPLVGTWVGKVSIDPAKSNDAKAMEEFKMAKMMEIELDLRQDNTSELQMMFDIPGKWKLDGRKVTINSTGEQKQAPMALTVSPDDKQLTLSDARTGTTVVFTKG